MKDDFGSFSELPSFETGKIEEGSSSFDSDDNEDRGGGEKISINEYALEVVKTMTDSGIYPNPQNFAIYFEKLLEDKPAEFRESALQQLQNDPTSVERQLALESKIVKIKKSIANIITRFNVMCENLETFQDIVDKHSHEVSVTSSAQAAQNIMMIFSKELEKIDEISKKQLQEIKDSCVRANQEISSLDDNIVLNDKYHIYNQRFLESKVTLEIQKMQGNTYKSSFMLIKTAKHLEKKVTNEKDAFIVNRSIVKILQKQISKSYTLAYCGNGIFGILLSHSNKDSTKRFANKISERVAQTDIFLDDKELSLSICSGIVEITSENKPKDIFKNASEALKKAVNLNASFVVFGDK